MADVAYPANVRWENFKYTMRRASATLRSPYDGSSETLQSAFKVWFFEGSLVPLDKDDAGPIRSFLIQLDGKANRTKLLLPDATESSTGYTGTGVTSGALSGGEASVATGGWTPGAAVAMEGDPVNIGDELKILTSNVVADGSGNATLTFGPTMRGALSSGAVVRVSDNYLWAVSDDDDIASWNITAPVEHGIAMKFVEDV